MQIKYLNFVLEIAHSRAL